MLISRKIRSIIKDKIITIRKQLKALRMAYTASKGYFKRCENEGNNEMYMFNNITNDCSNQVSNLQCKTLWYGIYTNVANIRRFINISNHRIRQRGIYEE